MDLTVEVEACGVAAAGEDADSKEKMNWLLRYRIKEFFYSSHWVAPMLGLILGIAMTPLTRWIDG